MPVKAAYKTDVIHSLKKELLVWQGFKKSAHLRHTKGLKFLERSFPQNVFPTGVVHDFISDGFSNAAATNGFISGVLGSLLESSQKINYLWVSPQHKIFPSALKLFGIDPDEIIFVNARSKPKDALWVIEEALKCQSLTAVVGEIQDIDFTASRRLQLAVEKSGVTGFIHRHNPKSKNPVACVASWKISSVKTNPQGMPGLGFARWNIELAKVRNGSPGNWLVEWQAGHFKEIKKQMRVISSQRELKVS